MKNGDKNTVQEALRRKLREELAREQAVTAKQVCQRIRAGLIVRATGNLLFHTEPTVLDQKLQRVLDEISAEYMGRDDVPRTHILDFLVNLSIGLSSFLPNWVLLKTLNSDSINAMSEKVLDTLAQLISADRQAPVELTDRLLKKTIARLRAEGISDENQARTIANHLMGDSLVDYVSNIVSELRNSNLIEAARARFRGATQTHLGNDYAAFLQYMIWLGGSFVTTNPVLVKLAWDINPELWNKRVDNLILSKYAPGELRKLLGMQQTELEKAVTIINSMVTMAVVEENCRLLRDIFLVTAGSEGYVSLQVNPKTHGVSEQMVAEARDLYKYLEQRLGGVPNVVFKLPGTAAGKSAAETLTSEGIGVTITVAFSVFQALGFAEVLDKGNMLVAYLALMNGRMAFPVRDEMKEKGVEGGVEAARLAGVEVVRKAYRRLYEPPKRGGMAVDPKRVKLLTASLRIYDDWIPDLSELWGCPVITIFPNVRRKYDSRRRRFDGNAVLGTTPDKEMKILFESEIFRQAWWIPGDSDQHKPKRVLTLEPQDEQALAKWAPVANTLGQFIDLYEDMGKMVRERIKHIVRSHDS
jgi:transaldolase